MNVEELNSNEVPVPEDQKEREAQKELETQMEASLVELWQNCKDHGHPLAQVVLSYADIEEKRRELKELMWHLLTAFGRSAFDFPVDEMEQSSKQWIFNHCQEDEALDWVKHIYFVECDLKTLNPLLEENEEAYKKSKKRLQKWLSE